MKMKDIADFVHTKIKEIQMSKVNVVDINSNEFEQKILEIISKKCVKKSDRFTIIEYPCVLGWVLDSKTGLEWGQSSPKSMNHSQAVEYCKEKGGRLPTREELQTLVDISKHEPCINKDIFTDTKNDYYWTSDITAWNKNAYWCVSFDFGVVNVFIEFDSLCVRPVRSSQ